MSEPNAYEFRMGIDPSVNGLIELLRQQLAERDKMNSPTLADLARRFNEMQCRYDTGWNDCLNVVQAILRRDLNCYQLLQLRRDLKSREQGVMQQVVEIVQVQRQVAADEIEELRKGNGKEGPE